MTKVKSVRVWALVRRRDGYILTWGNYGTAHNAVGESCCIFKKKYTAKNLFDEMGEVCPKKKLQEFLLVPIHPKKKRI